MCNSNYSFYFPFVLTSVDYNITRCHEDCHRHGLHFFIIIVLASLSLFIAKRNVGCGSLPRDTAIIQSVSLASQC